MSLIITYNILFEVNILHHYFLNRGERVFDLMTEEEKAEIMMKYDVREFFSIIPSDECRKKLEAHQCIFKATSKGLIVGLRAESNGEDPPRFKPFSHLPDDLEFIFHVHFSDHALMNYSALPLSGNGGTIYVFGNVSGGVARQYPSISATAPLFKTGTEYLPGDMVSDNLGNPTKLFIAKLKNTSGTSNTTNWLREKKADGFPVTYANVNDRRTLVRGTFLYRVTTAGVEPAVTIKNASGNEVKARIDIIPGDFRILQVDMRGLPEGIYSMHAESSSPAYSDDISFFLLQQSASPVGVIQVRVKSDQAAYNLLDAEGFMLSPEFRLRFRNRATHWRYIGKDFNEGSVTGLPLPLTRYGFVENVSVPDKDGVLVDDLPNPSVTTIRAEAMTKPDEKRFLSEIHIN
jgi:hypothetical protein